MVAARAAMVSRFGTGGEIRALPALLGSDEQVTAMVSASITGVGLLVVTTHRILFALRKSFTTTGAHIPWEQVGAFEVDPNTRRIAFFQGKRLKRSSRSSSPKS